MIRVIQVSNPQFNPTRLHLPGSAWGNMVQERLTHLGWTVQVTDQDPDSYVRDKTEIARMHAILEQIDPCN